MKLKAKFIGGPLHMIEADMEWLPEIQIITDEREDVAYAYVRSELTYTYDPETSAKLTQVMPQYKGKFKHNQLEVTGDVEDENDDEE